HDIESSETWDRLAAVKRRARSTGQPGVVRCESSLRLQRGPGAFDQTVVALRRAGQEEQARGEVALAPRGGDVVVVLHHGRAEFVVVGVVPLEEDQPPR